MTDNIDALRAEIAGQRLALFRILTAFPTGRLSEMADSARRAVQHIDQGGETFPPTGAAERAAMAVELTLIESSLANRIEHELPA